jgi:uncharacterized protein YukE
MRTYTLVAAALAVALTTGCKDRDRDDTGSRVDATADSAGDAVREGAHDVGDAADTAGSKVGDAVRDVGNATEDAARQATGTWTWNRREEYRQEARDRLAGLDRQLADLRKNVNHDASEAYTKGVAAARETRRDVGAHLDRLGQATESNWTEVRDEFRASIDSLARQLEALQPDAQPMGGAGPK